MPDIAAVSALTEKSFNRLCSERRNGSQSVQDEYAQQSNRRGHENSMPLFDFLCSECGKISEVLITSSDESPICTACGSMKLKKLLGAPSSLSGAARQGFPGPGDTSCCGTSAIRAGCAGPGSCCGKNQI